MHGRNPTWAESYGIRFLVVQNLKIEESKTYALLSAIFKSSNALKVYISNCEHIRTREQLLCGRYTVLLCLYVSCLNLLRIK